MVLESWIILQADSDAYENIITDFMNLWEEILQIGRLDE